jgi:hypothetical protein
MKIIIVTNNALVKEKFTNRTIDYLDGSLYDVLLKVRDYIHQGHTLLTHPLSGSVKPNETLYKSILISKKANGLDYDSLAIIEDSIQMTEKLLKDNKVRQWPERILKDFRVIDLDLITSGIESLI